MLDFVTNRGDLYNEFFETIRCFNDGMQSGISVNLTYVKTSQITVRVRVEDKIYKFVYENCNDSAPDKAAYMRHDIYVNKLSLYKALSDYFGVSLPWGSLTGVRPTRIARRISNGLGTDKIAEIMEKDYCVSPEKAKIAAEIIEIQRKHVGDRMTVCADSDSVDKLVNLYVHVPFCPTRCSYCSFVSQGVEKQKWLIGPYVDALIEEIRLTKEIIEKHGQKIFSVYVGGGTPTVLDPDRLYRLLSAARVDGTEFTCEAGRPDTFGDEKLSAISAAGVNRISINPQTLHDVTLQKIGRSHTTEQFYKAYEMSQKYGLQKNVDLIAGLSGENTSDFKYTLDEIIKLSPENITVHTLCLKRGSENSLSGGEYNPHTESMIDYSVSALSSGGYLPYYLYRQKQALSNLENIGWCKDGFICVNNVTVMEEMLSVYACGAGAIGKIIPPNGKIARLANPKDVVLYLDQFQERMNKKEIFYQNQFTLPR